MTNPICPSSPYTPPGHHWMIAFDGSATCKFCKQPRDHPFTKGAGWLGDIIGTDDVFRHVHKRILDAQKLD